MRATVLCLAATLPAAHAWACSATRPAVDGGRRASAVVMGSFDDMMAKTKQRDAERAEEAKKPRAPAAPASEGTSLAQQMANTVSDAGINRLFPAAAKLFGIEVDEEEDSAAAPAAASGPTDASAAAAAEVADIDARAQTGELSFTDFLTMSEAFAGLGEDKQLPGMPTLTPAQMAETREKFDKQCVARMPPCVSPLPNATLTCGRAHVCARACTAAAVAAHPETARRLSRSCSTTSVTTPTCSWRT